MGSGENVDDHLLLGLRVDSGAFKTRETVVRELVGTCGIHGLFGTF